MLRQFRVTRMSKHVMVQQCQRKNWEQVDELDSCINRIFLFYLDVNMCFPVLAENINFFDLQLH